MRRRRRARLVRPRAAGLAGLLMLTVAGLLAATPVAGAQEPTGKIRLGHLSLTTPRLDITLQLTVKPLVDVPGLPVAVPRSSPARSGPSGAPGAEPAAPAAPSPAPAARATPPGQAPVGGVPAGAGGASDDGGPGLLPLVLALAGAPLLAFSASTIVASRRRGG